MPDENLIVLSRAAAAIAWALLVRERATYAIVTVDLGAAIVVSLEQLREVAGLTDLISTARAV